MESRVLIDTNAVIDYLDTKLPRTSTQLIESNEVRISVITRIEPLGWSNATAKQMKVLEHFVNASIVYNLDELVILKAINLRKTIKIKLPDAIIAATALVHDLKLLTRNISDFDKVQGLDLINSYVSE